MIEVNSSHDEKDGAGDFTAAPNFATLRINSAKFPWTSFRTIAETLFIQDIKVESHPKIHDMLVVSGKLLESEADVKMATCSSYPIAVVSAECGNSVLRGANVFCPGVVALDSQALMNTEVSVFADRHNSVCKGSKCNANMLVNENSSNQFLYVGSGTLVASREDLFGSTRAQSQAPCKGVAVEMKNRKLPSFNSLSSNLFFPQNFPSLACTQILNPEPDDFVLDMCAAPGGKSGHIASRMVDGKGCLVSIDRTLPKVDKVVQHFKDWDLDLDRCPAFVADSSKPDFVTSLLKDSEGRSFQLSEEMFDKVLLDAPCSGLGKRPYIQREQDIPKLGTFHTFQRKFVRNAVKLLKPGGVLVYSTCTTRLEENENQVAWMLDTFGDTLELVPCEPSFEKRGRDYGTLDEKYLDFVQYFPPRKTDSFVWHPCESDTVGFFIAKFKKLSK